MVDRHRAGEAGYVIEQLQAAAREKISKARHFVHEVGKEELSPRLNAAVNLLQRCTDGERAEVHEIVMAYSLVAALAQVDDALITGLRRTEVNQKISKTRKPRNGVLLDEAVILRALGRGASNREIAANHKCKPGMIARIAAKHGGKKALMSQNRVKPRNKKTNAIKP